MADLASFSLSDRRAAPHSRAHQYRLTAVSAVIQSAARLERGRTLNNVRGREGGGRAGEGGGRGGDCPHFPQTRTFVTVRELEPSLGRFAFLTRWHSLHLPFR